MFVEQCVLGNVDLDGRLRFEDFDILTVLEKGEKLLGSAGDEYDMEEDPVFKGNELILCLLSSCEIPESYGLNLLYPIVIMCPIHWLYWID